MTIVQTFLLLCLFFVAKANHAELYRQLVYEQNFGEYLQFYLYLSLAVYCFSATRKKNLKDVVRHQGLYLRLWGLFFLLVALEEISWGQFIFGYEVPSVQKINYQGEVNIHNLFSLYGKVWPYIIFTFFWSLVAWPFERLLEQKGYIKGVFGDVQIRLSFGFLGLSYFVIPQHEYVYYYEYTELVVAMLFFQTFVREKKSLWAFLFLSVILSFLSS